MNSLPKSRRLIALLAFGAWLLLFVAGTGGPAVAQNAAGSAGGFSAALTLSDRQDYYELAPYLYVTRDSRASLSYQNVIERHFSGERGSEMHGNVLNLGGPPMPHWIIFEINNESWNDEWVLSFGTHMEGRVGLIKDLFIFEHNSKTKFFDNITVPQAPYIEQPVMDGASLRLKIARGQRATFVVYVLPEPGLPATLALSLMSEARYSAHSRNVLGSGRLMNLSFILTVGLFIGALVFRQLYSASLFILYFILQMILFNFHNEQLFSTSALSAKIPGLLLALIVICGLLATKFFLDIGKLQRLQSHMIIGFIIGIFSATFIALFISRDSAAQPVLMYLPSLFGILFMFLLSLAQARNGRYGAYQFAAAWGVMFTGALVSLLSFINLLVPTSVFIAAYWWSLLPHGLLLFSACATKLIIQEREIALARVLAEDDEQSLYDLKQSRDSAENSRLLRLIEYERAVLNELREREAQQNEEMRKAKELADDANRAKSAFLAVVSHEIRTPMTGVMGMVRLLLDTDLNKTQKDYAQTIQDSGDAMMALLNDILDFEKIESGKMDMEHLDFDLMRVINSITTLMSGHAEAKNIYLRADLDPALPRYVIGDPVRLRQVLLNLTGNSIKFTEHGGVTLRVMKEPGGEAMSEKGVHRIRFAVQDTGIGISAEAQRNLFNPFEQADSSTARKFGGTGLGLAISQKLIEGMGGRIQIDSTEGQGSTFYFSIIMEEGRAEAAEDSPMRQSGNTASNQEPIDILIVEDNEISQKLLKEFVDRMGHRTVCAGSGEEALEKLAEQHFDVILMDIALPGITGMGTTKAIRALEDRAKAATPVIALTGNVRDEDVRQCYAANMNGHLPKPVDPKKLKNMIEKVIGNELDNPVELEGEDGNLVTVERVIPTTNEMAPPPEPVPEPAHVDQPQPVDNDIDDDNETTDVKAVKTQSDHDDDKPPINRFVQNESVTDAMRQLSEEDLAENSFETALSKMTEVESNWLSNAPHGQVFDSMVIQSMRENVGETVFRALISELFEKADDIGRQLISAAQRGDAATIENCAHDLKGMAANFGLTELSRLADQAERAARRGQTEGLDSLAEELPLISERAKAALHDWMSEAV